VVRGTWYVVREKVQDIADSLWTVYKALWVVGRSSRSPLSEMGW
jgi:hypothetical protein